MYKTQVQYPGLPDLGQKLQDILMHENLAYRHYLHRQLIVALPVYLGETCGRSVSPKKWETFSGFSVENQQQKSPKTKLLAVKEAWW